MTLDDERSRQMAEVLRLHLTEGKGIRAIAKAMKMGRKKVRKLLGLAQGKDKPKPAQQRSSILAPYDGDIRKALDDCADIPAPAMLDRMVPSMEETLPPVTRVRMFWMLAGPENVATSPASRVNCAKL